MIFPTNDLVMTSHNILCYDFKDQLAFLRVNNYKVIVLKSIIKHKKIIHTSITYNKQIEKIPFLSSSKNFKNLSKKYVICLILTNKNETESKDFFSICVESLSYKSSKFCEEKKLQHRSISALLLILLVSNIFNTTLITYAVK